MQVSNAEVAAELDKIADLLDVEAANRFRVRAYRRAARLVGAFSRSVADMRGEELDDLPGIGADLAGKIATLARGGHLPLLDELEHEVPPGVTALLAIPGLGPRRVHQLHEALGINSVAELTEAANAGKLHDIPGFGRGLETKIMRVLASGAMAGPRTMLSAAEQIAIPLLQDLWQAEGVKKAEIAGSYRRRRETVGDIDIVVAAASSQKVMKRFTGYEAAAEVVEQGPTRATVRLRNGLQVDLRVVPEESYGAALCYFTGSKAHNIELRQIAVELGLKLNEYGLHRGMRQIAGRTEEELYESLRLRYIPPELREDQGEIDAARENRLPHLVSVKDIWGDLHVQTDATDGRASLREMVTAARARGYGYIAITDHSRRLGMAHGLDVKHLGRQMEEIDRLNDGLKGFTVLKAIEVDILEDGRLDLPDTILSKLDMVIGAVHSRFDLPQAQQTERILRAMDKHYFNILAHPTGRLINQRPAYAVDMERVMHGALERGCFLELNAQPERLDLNDAHCRLARSMGLKLAISTDAHAEPELGFMRFGVDQARRGWLEAADVLNTRPVHELLSLLRQRR